MEYGKLLNGLITYINPNKVIKNGVVIYNPSESVLNSIGIYRIINIEEDGENVIEDGVIKNYIGKIDNEPKMININARLEDMTELTEALERIIAQYGVTDSDKLIAQERINLRDEIGKVVQTTEGAGTDMDPYKYWKTGVSVKKGEWWVTEDGYLWEVKKDGIPSSSMDKEYFDII